ncbi:unnamed protein product, partial [Ectocarpus sp. 8 AP-2014]
NRSRLLHVGAATGVTFQTRWHMFDCFVIIWGWIYSSIVFSHRQCTHMSKSPSRTT